MSYAKKKMAMKVDEDGLAFIPQMDDGPGDRKNIDLVNKTKGLTWMDQLLNYWQTVIKQTSTSIELIKCERLRMNLPFDDKFKEEFVRAANTIIGCTVDQLVVSKPFNHMGAVQYSESIALNTPSGFDYGNHFGAAHCLPAMNLSPEPLIKTPGRPKVKLEVTDEPFEPLPLIKTEMSIASEALNITLPKTNRKRARAAGANSIMKKTNTKNTLMVPVPGKRATKDDKSAAHEPKQPKQQRKRKNTNTSIADNAKKRQKLNDTTAATAKPFKCDLCEYSTDVNRALSRHISSSHNVARLHECEICRIRFTARGNLNAHMRKHGDLFTYQCSNCRLGFANKAPWRAHESCCPAKNFLCYLCDKKFYQRRSDLIRHMRIWHTNERPYKCSDCPQAYNVKHELKRHVKCYHGRDI